MGMTQICYLVVLGLVGAVFSCVLWNIDWDVYGEAALFIKLGIIAEAGISLGAIGGVIYCAYRIVKR